MSHKIIIDTDIGDDVDDALAIAFALLQPEIDVRLISTVYGPTVRRAEMVEGILQAVSSQKGVDVAAMPPAVAGISMPLAGLPPEKASKLANNIPNQYGFLDSLPEREKICAKDAGEGVIDLFEEEAMRNPGEITLVTIGAMTNAAKFIEKKPKAAAKLKQISIMGGSFLEDRVEYNVKCDPDAAKIVMESEIPTAIFSWETSGKLRLMDDALDILRSCPGPVAKALVRCVELWTPFRGGKACPVLYDVSAILWLFRPDIYRIERRGIEVVLSHANDCSRTLLGSEGDRIVAMDMDVDKALSLFMETVCG